MHMAAACLAALFLGLFGSLPARAGEEDLINTLKGNSSWLDKQTACRALRQTGTAECVPALAALLNDRDLSHLARFALEAMPFAEAGQALRDALAKTDGAQKMGVVISLGARRDAKAVPFLIPLLKDACADTASAAAGALGRIATPEAIACLFEALDTAPGPVQAAVSEGLLASADYLTQEGKSRRAAAVCKELMDEEVPLYVRMGAFGGLIAAQPKAAPGRLIDALGGKDAELRDMAAAIIGEHTDRGATKRYAAALPKLPAAGQVALLRGLADRKDRAARAAAAKAIGNADAGVKLAAVKALGMLGGADDVPALTALLTSENAALAEAAKGSLTILESEGVNPALAAAAASAAPAVRVPLLDLMTERRAEQTLPLALKNLNDAELSVRAAALHALAAMGAQEQIPVVLNTLKASGDANEQASAEKALAGMCSRAGQGTLPILVEAMNGTSPAVHNALLRVTAGLGGAKALEIILAALTDADPQVSGEAAGILGNWPTPDAAPHLLALAQSEDLNRKALGLRGYVRLAGLNAAVEERSAMLAKAMGLAQRPEEKRIVLSAWGALKHPASLDALQPHLEDASVQNEAAVAIIGVAADLGKRDPNCKPRAIAALSAVAAKCADPDIRDRAQKILAGLQ